mmetsp:Transcript_159552/g.488242  ORF Transcript_159552/g.488242 Transcript_159552/m.488242 type:complete len:352 (-) Transcript_159552:111-1166(-)
MSGFGDRLTELLNASATSTAIGIASRSGLLRHLGPEALTSEAIAEAAGLHRRYVEEILAVLACGKVVELVDESPLRYALPADRKAALDGMGLYFEELPLLTRCAFDEVVAATRTGGGVPSSCYGAFGAWMGKLADEKHEATLLQKFLPSLAQGSLEAKLQEGARVLDLGCGEGTAACLMAQHFPATRVTALDAWKPSVDAGKERAARHGLTNADFVCGNAGDFAEPDAAWTGQFDLVTSFDVIHDLTRPEAALRECHRVLKPETGVFAMVDIRARSGLSANLGHQMAPFLYCVSLMHCMPQGMNDGGPGLGMMWGREKAVSMLQSAGFEVEVVEMEFDTFNDCYLCRPRRA